MANNPTNNDTNLHLHLQESEDLKKQWFTYVFESIRKLYDKIEVNAIQSRKEKEELLFLGKKYEIKVSLAQKEKMDVAIFEANCILDFS
jgi:hypothetical protein